MNLNLNINIHKLALKGTYEKLAAIRKLKTAYNNRFLIYFILGTKFMEAYLILIQILWHFPDAIQHPGLLLIIGAGIITSRAHSTILQYQSGANSYRNDMASLGISPRFEILPDMLLSSNEARAMVYLPKRIILLKSLRACNMAITHYHEQLGLKISLGKFD